MSFSGRTMCSHTRPKVGHERPDRVGGNRGVLLTRSRRTELLEPHGGKDVVVTRQRRKEIDRVVSQRRHGLVRRRVSSRQNGRHRIGRVVRHGAGVAKPVRLPGERAEIRVPLGVDVSPASSRLFMGNSSNTTSTIGGVRSSRLHRRRRFRRQKTLFHSWIEKKQCRDDERGRRERRQELPNGADSTVGNARRRRR